MRLFFIISLQLLSIALLTAGRGLEQAKWQQRVNCKIDVQLDPVRKMLNAQMQMHYYNNSPDTLHSIWLHVWPNAYKNNGTAFAKQELRNGKTEFHFSREQDRGFINGFRFESNGDTMQWKSHPMHIDIVELKLNKPLLPGSDLVISTPFTVKLPRIFSRGGYKDSFFAITQWYPKPAVYDVNGWNPMPYLDQGEFYSEFGNYRVSITVPRAYVVASTGHLVNQKDTVINGSVAARRTTYEENNIHDFAWFAAMDFRVTSRMMPVGGGDSVRISVYYSGVEKEKEKKPIYYLDKAVTEYSERVGKYPYKTCTVVAGPLEAGAGMEYPTITICGNMDGSTIIHEVGHNWFYGMVATNERAYPWMDESLNTFYENWISEKFRHEPGFFGKIKNSEWLGAYQSHLTYLFSARQGISQALNLQAPDYTQLNYGAIIYYKGSLLFAYLKQQLGDTVFSKCVKDYFNEWKYRHPLPKDMQNSFERSCGMNLDWFFVDLLEEDNEIDIRGTADGFKVKGSRKLDSFLRKKDYSSANPYGFLPEKNYNNNLRRKQFISLAIPFRLPRHDVSVPMNLTPVIGTNLYDGLYVGAMLFNRTIFRNRIEYFLMPAFSTRREKPVGYARLNALFTKSSGCFYKIETGVQGQSFGNTILDQRNQYYRINPYVHFYFRDKGRMPMLLHKKLTLDLYRTGLQRNYNINLDSNGSYRSPLPAEYFSNYVRLAYIIENRHPVNAYEIKLNGEYATNYKFGPGQNTYLKTWINAFYKFSFAPKNKFFKSELFAGVFLDKKGLVSNRGFFLSGNNGNMDYLYSEAMIGRNETFSSNNLLSRQVINVNGNMRNLLPVVGSDRWMLALANEVSLPGFIPLRVYIDFGYFQSVSNTPAGLVYDSPELYTTAGVLLPLFKGNLEIFVPFYQSEQFNYNQVKKRFINTIGFKLHLNRLNPFKSIDNYKLF